MTRLFRRKSFFISFLAFVVLALYQRYAPAEFQITQPQPTPAVQGTKDTSTEGAVTKVVDGDTIEVVVQGEKKKVRIVGINTPESVDPRRGVQCFGKEASAYAKNFLQGKTVRLEPDASQTETDKYGRLLRYVWVDKTDIGKHMIEEGYAHEYTYDIPYKYHADYIAAQQLAQQQAKGFWADASCAQDSK